MNQASKAIFPAVIIGILVVVGISRALLNPSLTVQASDLETPPTPVEQASAEEADQTDSSIECQLSPRYPQKIQQWCPYIQQAAIQYQLDANLIAAVMLQESGGNPDAYSRSGAVGLMQVMPRDGKAAEFMCVNGPCFANRPSMQELFDPQFNIDYGVRMLAGLIQRKGDVREALKSYGPMDMGYAYADKVLAIYENYR
ncbi:MAG: lytic transglycosylase domain-containing protein [Bellilinea sp.]|nr:lytic transglycosylase domain-containing protein [Bellilinea sp.]